MLTAETIERIERLEGRGFPVLSVYLGLDPGRSEGRSIAARLKDVLKPVSEEAEGLGHAAAKSLRSDIEGVLGLEELVGLDGVRGVAVFASRGAGIKEVVHLPSGVRDRAVVDSTAYTRPLRAMWEELHRFCAVVIDRRTADIFEFHMGRLQQWEELAEEELRKSNFGGFSGYEERRVRAHADEVARRHYRAAAARLHELAKADEFDLLLVGGRQDGVDALLAELHPDVAERLAGTFAIDLHTMTPAAVQEHCRVLAEEHDRHEQEALVTEVLDRANSGNKAVVGLEDVLAAVNRQAVAVLVVDTRASPAGGRCARCGALALEGPCAVCGGPTRPVPDIIDGAALAVRAAGGEVKHILAETQLAAHHIGAVLRFPVQRTT